MDAKRLLIQLLGILSLICGGLLGILWLRTAYFMLNSTILGNPPNFVARMSQAWFLGLAAYLISVGLRGVRWERNKVEAKVAKVKWGRVLSGSFLILCSAVNISNHFHPVPNRFELKPSNETEAAAMKVTQVVLIFLLPIPGAWLVASGIRAQSEIPVDATNAARTVS
jgi:hypothetical protein